MKNNNETRRKNIESAWSVFFVIGLVLLLNTRPLYATTVSVSAPPYLPTGEEFSVEIALDNVTDLYGLAADLVYDTQLIKVVDVDATPANGIQPKVVEGLFLSNNGVDTTFLRSALQDGLPGALVLGISRAGNTAGVNASTNTIILSVTFKAVGEGIASIDFNKQALKDSTNTEISVAAWNGSTITLCSGGDANKDGQINILDAIEALRIIVGLESPPTDLCPLDFNVSGAVDVADLIRIMVKSLP